MFHPFSQTSLVRLHSNVTRAVELQGEFNDLLLVPAVAAYPELFPLPRVGISHNAWVKLFRSWIVSTAVPTTGWVGAQRPFARRTSSFVIAVKNWTGAPVCLNRA
jgi:hypothetical protein